MKYLIQGIDNFGQKVELSLYTDDGEDTADRIFACIPRSDTEDHIYTPEILYIPISQFYQFMDNIQKWCPDPRKEK